MKRVTITANRLDRNGTTIQVPIIAQISTSITERVLSEVKAWGPALKRHAEEDASWDWTQFLHKFRSVQRENLDEFEYGVLLCKARTQAIMIMETANHLSRRGNKPLVYVEYLAVAPWNRPGIQNPRRFTGCGSILVHHAVERSESLGYGGLVGLHALPGARPFYVRIGFKDFGADTQEGGLHYLQLND
jgi:GNAT superfamily N-acetyltransferase